MLHNDEGYEKLAVEDLNWIVVLYQIAKLSVVYRDFIGK